MIFIQFFYQNVFNCLSNFFINNHLTIESGNLLKCCLLVKDYRFHLSVS